MWILLFSTGVFSTGVKIVMVYLYLLGIRNFPKLMLTDVAILIEAVRSDLCYNTQALLEIKRELLEA